MDRIILGALTLTAILLGTSASRADSLIDVDLNQMDSMSWSLTITPRDDLTINKAVFNRGFCQPQTSSHLPLPLKFGQQILFGYFLCEPIEIEFDTDKGVQQSNAPDQIVQAGVSVAKQPETEAIWDVLVTAREDHIKVTSVTVNRGNCQSTVLQSPDHQGHQGQLEFGQRMWLDTPCDPIEVTVVTDLGSGTFTF